MMKPNTVIRIYRAAEDWVQGLLIKEIYEKHHVSSPTFYEWMETDAWNEAVAGRVRQKRKPFVRFEKYDDLDSVKFAAQRWVAFGKPSVEILSEKTGILTTRLEKWMSYPFWEYVVIYAEHRAKREENKPPGLVKAGPKFPNALLKQAVFLHLAGWKIKEIAPAINREWQTINDWKRTDAWYHQEDEIMLDKLMMHLLDKGMTTQEMFRAFCESQGLDTGAVKL